MHQSFQIRFYNVYFPFVDGIDNGFIYIHTVYHHAFGGYQCCLLYTSDAADERSSVDLGGRRIIKKKK